MRRRFQHVTIIGVGLLGGSIGLALKRRFRAHVAGVGRRQASLDEALRRGTIDEAFLDAAAPASRSDLVILATPVRAFEAHLRAIAPVLKPSCLVTDVGSTKAVVVASAQRVFRRGRCPFVGSHPMAGSEQRGSAFAREDLLEGTLCLITPTARTADADVAAVEALWSDLGMRVMRMTPAAHDRAVAAISHLPHALSALLMLLPAEGDLKLSAGGFRDMTRLSAGDVEMWRDIFLTNPKAVAAALDRFGRSLAKLREAIARGDAAKIEKLLTQARRRRQDFANRDV